MNFAVTFTFCTVVSLFQQVLSFSRKSGKMDKFGNSMPVREKSGRKQKVGEPLREFSNFAKYLYILFRQLFLCSAIILPDLSFYDHGFAGPSYEFHVSSPLVAGRELPMQVHFV